MRGQKISKDSRKLDILLVAARYDRKGLLDVARGYERRGVVWTDVRLYDRDMLLERILAGDKVYTGEPVELPGNFKPIHPVRALGGRAAFRLATIEEPSAQDDLNLPVF